MPEHYVSIDDVVGILEDAAIRLREEGSDDFARDAAKIEQGLTVIRTLPEPYWQASGEEVQPPPAGDPGEVVHVEDTSTDQLEVEMMVHLEEAVRISDGCDGWNTDNVFTRRVRTYDGHRYLVTITDMDVMEVIDG